MFLSAVNNHIYYVFAALVYGCIAAVFFLALYFGLRARRYVKNERVTSLPDGLSPLDVQRIFYGKTYPNRITAALLAHWAKRGFIKLKYVSKYVVRVTKLKDMPTHIKEDAEFFDRGTYVRERDLFRKLISKLERSPSREVNLLKPMFTAAEISRINDTYAVREDEGVFSAKHYSLKILTMALAILPFAFCAVWLMIATGNFMGLVLVGTAVIGLFVFKFAQGMPLLFKLIWCGMWLGASVGAMIMFFTMCYDPFGIIYTAVAALFGESLIIIRFVDHREKNNLDDYSNIVNYKKYLLHAPESELQKLDYLTVLPYLYAFNIKWRVKRKLNRTIPEDVYCGDDKKEGALL